jgi:hypothetical protein
MIDIRSQFAFRVIQDPAIMPTIGFTITLPEEEPVVEVFLPRKVIQATRFSISPMW